jgi:hypothetical protein
MSRRSIAASRATVAVVSASLCGAAVASVPGSAGAARHARGSRMANPTKVMVKVLGRPPAERVLLDRTVQLTGKPVRKDGGSCSGDSAAGALQLATKGRWSGSWDAEYSDYEVTKIAGVSLPFEAKSSKDWYWSLWVGGREASVGVCEAKPKSGEIVLFRAACYGKACPRSTKKGQEQRAAGERRRR